MQSPRYQIQSHNVYQLLTVGAITGFLTAGLLIQFSSMAWFGIALAAYLYAYAGFRPLSRLIVFALTTSAIGFIGQIGAALTTLGNWNQWNGPLLMLETATIWGGAEIAAVLLTVWALLIPSSLSSRPRAFRVFVALMVVGVFTAAIGWQLGSTLGMWMWHGLAPLRSPTPLSPRDLPSFGPLSFGLVTQAGCAALVGLALWQIGGDAEPQSDAPKRRSPPFWPVYLFIVPAIVTVAIGAKAEIHFADRMAESPPPAVSGWITKPRSFDEVFIMTPDEKVKASYGFSFASDHLTQIVQYSIGPEPLDNSKPNENAHFTVTVSQYPNAEWASFGLRRLPTPACLELYPSLIHKRVISGQVVLTCAFLDDPNFYWASHDVNIEISFQRTVSEEVLNRYLERYPADKLPSVYERVN